MPCQTFSRLELVCLWIELIRYSRPGTHLALTIVLAVQMLKTFLSVVKFQAFIV